ncbi:hypothetical protein GQ457_06G010170 [Hibiscus cannabinus]
MAMVVVQLPMNKLSGGPLRDKSRLQGLGVVDLKLNANRMVVGTLRRFDQFINLVLDNTVEVNVNEKIDIGMVVIRGNNDVIIEALEHVGRIH